MHKCMPRPAEIGTLVVAAFALVLFPACRGNVQPQNVTVTATINGEDGVSTPVAPVSLELTHVPAGSSSARLLESGAGMQNEQSVSLDVQRTGIPLTESYWFLNLSRVESRPGSGDVPAEATGSPGFIRNHVGDFAVLGLRPDQLDSPLQDSLQFSPTTGLRLTGTSYLARVETDDPEIPFSDPSAPIDISRLSGGLRSAIGSVVTTSISTRDFIALGGSNGAGDFRLFFIPHLRHTTLTNSPRNIKGVGFIFRFTANVTVGVNLTEFQVYIPISLLLEPVPFPGGGQRYEAFLDPFSMIGGQVPSDNLSRITVRATGLFDQSVADQTRTAMVNAINGMTQAQLDQLDLLAEGLTALINSFRNGNPPIPADWNVILLPEQRPQEGTIPNLFSPDPGGVAVKLVLLE